MASGPESNSPSVAGHGQSNSASVQAGGDRTLVIPPAGKQDRQPQPNSEATVGALIGPDNAPPPSNVSVPANQGALPYLGVAVTYTVSNRGGQKVNGLEVMSVDPDSPAQRAGLRARTAMTTLGATGATAGQLLGPLDIALEPLLAKSGQLGRDGDLIVAIDDHRVTDKSDLANRLARLHPGDIIYLTVLRQERDGSYKTVKIPVTLGSPRSVDAKESAHQ